MADESEDRHLVLFAAFEDLRKLSSRPQAAAATVPASRLIDYASRTSDVADLQAERLIRENARARSIYMQAMEWRAGSYSPVAVAASGKDVLVRLIGPHRLELIEEGDVTFVTLHLADSSASIEWMEVRTPDGWGGRMRLGEPIRNVVQVPLDHRYEELAAIDEVIRRPDCHIYLSP